MTTYPNSPKIFSLRLLTVSSFIVASDPSDQTRLPFGFGKQDRKKNNGEGWNYESSSLNAGFFLRGNQEVNAGLTLKRSLSYK